MLFHPTIDRLPRLVTSKRSLFLFNYFFISHLAVKIEEDSVIARLNSVSCGGKGAVKCHGERLTFRMAIREDLCSKSVYLHQYWLFNCFVVQSVMRSLEHLPFATLCNCIRNFYFQLFPWSLYSPHEFSGVGFFQCKQYLLFGRWLLFKPLMLCKVFAFKLIITERSVSTELFISRGALHSRVFHCSIVLFAVQWLPRDIQPLYHALDTCNH